MLDTLLYFLSAILWVVAGWFEYSTYRLNNHTEALGLACVSVIFAVIYALKVVRAFSKHAKAS